MERKKHVMGFMTLISCIEITIGIILGTIGFVSGELTFQNMYLMIGIGFFVGAGFTFIIGFMVGSIMSPFTIKNEKENKS